MRNDQIKIFSGISREEYNQILEIGGARTENFGKNQVIFRAGEEVSEVAEVINGSIHVNKTDFWGNNIIVYRIMPGQIFAGSYAICQTPLAVDAVAASECRVLFLNIRSVLSSGDFGKSWYSKLMYNLLYLSNLQNIMLSGRIFTISSKNIRTRVMLYLSSEATKSGNDDVRIPFDRQQMADYLNVERTALSKELGKMRDDGLIDFSKNRFHLIKYE